MAIGATTVWRVRAGGNQAYGGGYDPGIAGAATDYTDSDTAILSITDGATSGAGSTTLTSAAAGFTSAMVGNCIRISAGTNFQTGYYFLTGYTNTTTVTLDRTPTSGGAGSGGTGKIGGAFTSIYSLATGGTNTQPTITSPLAAGHTIMVRAGGGTPDYFWNAGYWTFPAGNTTTGLITIAGYNATPQISCDGLMFYQMDGYRISNLKLVCQNTTLATAGMIYGSGTTAGSVSNCIFDQNSIDVMGVSGMSVIGCWFLNSGATQTSATQVAITAQAFYNSSIRNNVINGWRGGGILTLALAQAVSHNIICNLKGTSASAVEIGSSSAGIGTTVIGNTIYNCANDGIKISAATALVGAHVRNNTISNNAGYGINVSVGNTALNDRTFNDAPDYNNVYNNTVANYHNMSAGAHDVSVDPQFTNTGTLDFSIGTNLKGLGTPGAFPTGSTGYTDIGAVERQEISPVFGTSLILTRGAPY